MSGFQNMRNKYWNLSEEVKATIWYTICSVLIKAISLITVPLFTRILSEAEYGFVSVYNGWKEIFIIFGTLNLYYAAYNNALVKYKEDVDGYTSTMIVLIDIISTFYALFYFLNKDFWDSFLGTNSVVMSTIFLTLFTFPAYNFWMAKQRFNFKYKKVVAVTLCASLASPVLSVVLIIFMDNNANAKIIGAEIPTIIIGLLFTVFFVKSGKKLFSKEYWRYGLGFTLPLIPHYLSGTVLNQSDRIMISRLVSDNKAGIYSVAYSAAFTISIITSAINNSLIPWMYKRLEAKDFFEIRRQTMRLLMLLAVILLLFILVVPEIIFILAPESYRDATGILPVLVMSVFFQFLYGFFGTVEFYYEKPIYAMLASVVASASNVLLNWIFIPRIGYFAAGYTTLVCFVIMSICHYLFMKRVLKCNNIQASVFDFKKIVVISLGFILLGCFESVLYSNLFARYVLVIIILVVLYLNRSKIVGALR
ncbi:oligosaccharide flippase family protein [Faecalimonas mobilis]